MSILTDDFAPVDYYISKTILKNKAINKQIAPFLAARSY